MVLTADDTLMSDYHNNEFLGFGACAPPSFIPQWLFRYLFFPPIKTRKGAPLEAPYGLRKIEAQLLTEGFDVKTVTPRHIKEHVSEVKVIGIHTMDPFGLGPASTTLAALLKKEPYLAKCFRILLNNPGIKEAQKTGAKIIVGGPGAWQFKYRPELIKRRVIDCVFEGESEKTIGRIVGAALRGEGLPQYYQTKAKETPLSEEIPNIVNPSINGLVELGRGCCRGCEFCNVTLRPLRWHPPKKILKETEVNINSGRGFSTLHAEDVMLYGSKNTSPNEERIIGLHKLIAKKASGIGWSHCSLASVASSPRVFSKIAEIVLSKQSWWSGEIGIETGSSRLAQKTMPAKAHPFKAADWPQVVREGMGLMHDNKFVPACTLIVGLPEEKEEDIIATMELLDDLKDVRSLVIPLFFVPLGRLKSDDWFRFAEITELHKQLLFKCLEHDFHWLDNLLEWTFTGKWYNRLLREFYKGFAGIIKQKAKKIDTSTWILND